MSAHASAALSYGVHPAQFNPGSIAEVAAGLWWDPAAVRGSGASIVLPEMNGRSAFDMVTPAANTAPASSSTNGSPILAFTNGSPDQLIRTATTKQRGWTGPTVVWGWLNRSANLGTVLGHIRSVTNIAVQFTASDVRLAANDGTTTQEARFPLPAGGLSAGPVFYWGVIIPGQALQMWYDGVQQTPTLAATMGASVLDTAEYLNVGGASGDNTTFNYSSDFSVGAFGFTNGVPSALDHAKLRTWHPLK